MEILLTSDQLFLVAVLFSSSNQRWGPTQQPRYLILVGQSALSYSWSSPFLSGCILMLGLMSACKGSRWKGPALWGCPTVLLKGFSNFHCNWGASLVIQMVESACNTETQVRSLGQKVPLEKGLATHSSVLAWKVLWTEEPGGLQSIGLQRVRHDWVIFTSFHFTSL